MFDTTTLKQARRLASLVCEARHIADELADDLNRESGEAKNRAIEEQLVELSDMFFDMAGQLGETEGELDSLIEPYDSEVA